MVNVADGCGSSILGYPRIGPHRELEYALEGYWRGTHSRAGLLPVAPRHPPRRWGSFPRETRSCTPVTKLGQGRVEWEDYCKLWDNGTANVSLGYRWWNCSSAVANCVTAWEDPSLGAGTFGLMSVFRSTSNNGVTHLLDVHVRLNPDPQGNGIAGGTTENAVQARKTTCHELGHALGLAHISDTTSCMPQGAALDESQNPPVQLISSVPNAHDFDTIFQQHNHTH